MPICSPACHTSPTLPVMAEVISSSGGAPSRGSQNSSHGAGCEARWCSTAVTAAP